MPFFQQYRFAGRYRDQQCAGFAFVLGGQGFGLAHDVNGGDFQFGAGGEPKDSGFERNGEFRQGRDRNQQVVQVAVGRVADVQPPDDRYMILLQGVIDVVVVRDGNRNGVAASFNRHDHSRNLIDWIMPRCFVNRMDE